MAHTDDDLQAEPDPHRRAVEQALRSGQRAERARQQASEAQRSAADSLERSAVSQDRVAKTYEEASGRRDDYRAHAAAHRQFAQDDYRMAERLRHMAEPDATTDRPE